MALMRAYAPHERLVLHARQAPQLWRLALGLLLAAIIMFALTRAFFALASAVLSEAAFFDLAAGVEASDTPTGLLVLLLLMGSMGVGTMVAAELLHRRAASSLFGPWRSFFHQFFRVCGALALLYAVIALLPPWGLPEGTSTGVPKSDWLALLPLSFAAILVQTGSEELLFRGYLQSQLAARFQHPGVWMALPAGLFAILHYAPDHYGGNAEIVVLWAFAFGLAAADLTARTGTLGPAIALHFANNIFAIAILSTQGEMSGLALYHLPYGPDDTAAFRALLPLDLAMIAISWLTARLALRC